jgi:hypothetical protein
LYGNDLKPLNPRVYFRQFIPFLGTVGFLIGNLGTFCSAQTVQAPPIHVETREVVLPVQVIEETKDPKGLLTYPDGTVQHVYILHSRELKGLSAKSFHIFEGSVEQSIQHFSLEKENQWVTRDNVGQHVEYSCTPKGIWSGSDRKEIATIQSLQLHTYLLTYVPPSSPEGTCHRIALKIDHKHATIFAPEQYCNMKDPLSDPVKGTDLGERLLNSLVSQPTESLPLLVQVNPFVGRVNISAQIPADLLKRSWHGTQLRTSIAILGLIYDKTEKIVSRFSDIACVPPESNVEWNGPLPPDDAHIHPLISQLMKYWEDLMVPTTYQAQLELGPGDYRLELVLTDGEKFGRSITTVTADDFMKEGLAISGIALCKRYHTPSVDERGPTRAPQYVPLMFDGVEFTPTGDTQFKEGEQLMTYVEIYGSELRAPAATKLFLEMKIIDEKTGELKIGTGVRPVDSQVRPDSQPPAIPIVWKMEVAKLPAGSYRLEAQASDSAGNKTPWRTTPFSVE